MLDKILGNPELFAFTPKLEGISLNYSLPANKDGLIIFGSIDESLAKEDVGNVFHDAFQRLIFFNKVLTPVLNRVEDLFEKEDKLREGFEEVFKEFQQTPKSHMLLMCSSTDGVDCGEGMSVEFKNISYVAFSLVKTAPVFDISDMLYNKVIEFN